MLKRFFVICLLLLAALALSQNTILRPYDGLRFRSDDARLNVWRAVSPLGQVHLPMVGRVDCAGLTLEQFVDRLKGALAKQGIAADVEVKRAINPGAPLSIEGACHHTGEVPWKPGRRLSYLLELGGPTDAADISKIQITDGLGVTQVIDASASGFAGAAADIELRPGDRVSLPLAKVSNVVYVLGGVKNPGSYPLEEGMNAARAIALAGGVSGHGDPTKISVERGGQPADLSQPLMRGDVIRVGLASVRSFISVQGAVVMPGVVEFRPGMTLSQVLKEAGGTTTKADLRKVRIKVIGGPERIVDYLAIRNKTAEDVVLEPSNIVDVPLLRSKEGGR